VKAGNSGQYIVKPQVNESGPDQEFKEVGNNAKENNGNGPKEKESRFKGTIAGIAGDVWTVTIGDESQTVNVAGADIKGEPAVGRKVMIEGEVGDGNIIIASFAHILGLADSDEQEQEENEIEFKGPVSNLSPLVIAGYTIVTNEATITKGTLAVGQSVEVEGLLQADGSVLAKKIEVDDESAGNQGKGPKTTKENNGQAKGKNK
jgi:hypothetical protein